MGDRIWHPTQPIQRTRPLQKAKATGRRMKGSTKTAVGSDGAREAAQRPSDKAAKPLADDH
jgi:hypothetical protein